MYFRMPNDAFDVESYLVGRKLTPKERREDALAMTNLKRDIARYLSPEMRELYQKVNTYSVELTKVLIEYLEITKNIDDARILFNADYPIATAIMINSQIMVNEYIREKKENKKNSDKVLPVLQENLAACAAVMCKLSEAASASPRIKGEAFVRMAKTEIDASAEAQAKLTYTFHRYGR